MVISILILKQQITTDNNKYNKLGELMQREYDEDDGDYNEDLGILDFMNVGGYSIKILDNITIQCKGMNIKSIVDLYNFMIYLKAANRISQDSYIDNMCWGGED